MTEFPTTRPDANTEPTPTSEPAGPWLVVGLGNPGKKYAKTRHNVGFMVVDALAARVKGAFADKSHLKSHVAQVTIDGHRMILAKPQTYMNLSGHAVQVLMATFDIPPSQVLIIYDDIDIALGRLRLRTKGTGGTHNGMKSLLEVNPEFNKLPRLRFGVGPYTKEDDLADFVLMSFSASQQPLVETVVNASAEAVLGVCELGLEAMMNRTNGLELTPDSEILPLLAPPPVVADEAVLPTSIAPEV